MYKKAIEYHLNDHRSFNNYAAILDKMLKEEEAEKLYLKAIEIKPRAKYYLNYGMMLYRMKRYEDALTQLQKALSLDDEKSKIYKFLGKVYAKLGQVDEAIKTYKKGKKVDPYNFKMRRDYANLLYDETLL